MKRRAMALRAALRGARFVARRARGWKPLVLGWRRPRARRLAPAIAWAGGRTPGPARLDLHFNFGVDFTPEGRRVTRESRWTRERSVTARTSETSTHHFTSRRTLRSVWAEGATRPLQAVPIRNRRRGGAVAPASQRFRTTPAVDDSLGAGVPPVARRGAHEPDARRPRTAPFTPTDFAAASFHRRRGGAVAPERTAPGTSTRAGPVAPELVWRKAQDARESPALPRGVKPAFAQASRPPESTHEIARATAAVPMARSGAAAAIDPGLAERLADDVMRRMEKRLRIERERRGF